MEDNVKPLVNENSSTDDINFHNVNNQDVNLIESSNVSDNGNEKDKYKPKKKNKVKKMLKKLEKRIIHGGKKEKGKEINSNVNNMNLENSQEVEQQQEVNIFIKDEIMTESNQFSDEPVESQNHKPEKENVHEELKKDIELKKSKVEPNEIVEEKFENDDEEKLVEEDEEMKDKPELEIKEEIKEINNIENKDAEKDLKEVKEEKNEVEIKEDNLNEEEIKVEENKESEIKEENNKVETSEDEIMEEVIVVEEVVIIEEDSEEDVEEGIKKEIVEGSKEEIKEVVVEPEESKTEIKKDIVEVEESKKEIKEKVEETKEDNKEIGIKTEGSQERDAEIEERKEEIKVGMREDKKDDKEEAIKIEEINEKSQEEVVIEDKEIGEEIENNKEIMYETVNEKITESNNFEFQKESISQISDEEIDDDNSSIESVESLFFLTTQLDPDPDAYPVSPVSLPDIKVQRDSEQSFNIENSNVIEEQIYDSLNNQNNAVVDRIKPPKSDAVDISIGNIDANELPDVIRQSSEESNITKELNEFTDALKSINEINNAEKQFLIPNSDSIEEMINKSLKRNAVNNTSRLSTSSLNLNNIQRNSLDVNSIYSDKSASNRNSYHSIHSHLNNVHIKAPQPPPSTPLPPTPPDLSSPTFLTDDRDTSDTMEYSLSNLKGVKAGNRFAHFSMGNLTELVSNREENQEINDAKKSNSDVGVSDNYVPLNSNVQTVVIQDVVKTDNSKLKTISKDSQPLQAVVYKIESESESESESETNNELSKGNYESKPLTAEIQEIDDLSDENDYINEEIEDNKIRDNEVNELVEIINANSNIDNDFNKNDNGDVEAKRNTNTNIEAESKINTNSNNNINKDHELSKRTNEIGIDKAEAYKTSSKKLKDTFFNIENMLDDLDIQIQLFKTPKSKLSDTNVKKTDANVKPSDTNVKKTDTNDKQSDTNVKKTDTNEKSLDINVKKTDINIKPSDVNVKPSDVNVKPSDTSEIDNENKLNEKENENSLKKKDVENSENKIIPKAKRTGRNPNPKGRFKRSSSLYDTYSYNTERAKSEINVPLSSSAEDLIYQKPANGYSNKKAMSEINFASRMQPIDDYDFDIDQSNNNNLNVLENSENINNISASRKMNNEIPTISAKALKLVGVENQFIPNISAKNLKMLGMNSNDKNALPVINNNVSQKGLYKLPDNYMNNSSHNMAMGMSGRALSVAAMEEEKEIRHTLFGDTDDELRDSISNQSNVSSSSNTNGKPFMSNKALKVFGISEADLMNNHSGVAGIQGIPGVQGVPYGVHHGVVPHGVPYNVPYGVPHGALHGVPMGVPYGVAGASGIPGGMAVPGIPGITNIPGGGKKNTNSMYNPISPHHQHIGSTHPNMARYSINNGENQINGVISSKALKIIGLEDNSGPIHINNGSNNKKGLFFNKKEKSEEAKELNMPVLGTLKPIIADYLFFNSHGGAVKGWKRRFIVLTPENWIYYFRNHDPNSQALAGIPINSTTTVEEFFDPLNVVPHVIEIASVWPVNSINKKYITIGIDNKQRCQAWIASIKSLIARDKFSNAKLPPKPTNNMTDVNNNKNQSSKNDHSESSGIDISSLYDDLTGFYGSTSSSSKNEKNNKKNGHKNDHKNDHKNEHGETNQVSGQGSVVDSYHTNAIKMNAGKNVRISKHPVPIRKESNKIRYSMMASTTSPNLNASHNQRLSTPSPQSTIPMVSSSPVLTGQLSTYGNKTKSHTGSPVLSSISVPSLTPSGHPVQPQSETLGMMGTTPIHTAQSSLPLSYNNPFLKFNMLDKNMNNLEYDKSNSSQRQRLIQQEQLKKQEQLKQQEQLIKQQQQQIFLLQQKYLKNKQELEQNFMDLPNDKNY